MRRNSPWSPSFFRPVVRAAIVLALLVLLVAAGGGRVGAGRAVPPTTAVAGEDTTSVGATTENPFGVMSGWGQRAREHFESFVDLGARYYRPLEIALDREPSCAECERARQAGFELVLSVRANGGGAGEPSTPPADLAQYEAQVRATLARERPALLVVENEPDSPLFYAGTPAEYLRLLETACAAAHSMDIPCADGGLTSATIIAMVLTDYWERGEYGPALDLARRVLPTWGVEPPPDARMLERFLIDRGFELAERGRAFISGYAAAGADYLNFHWYVGDGQALREAVEFLRRAGGGLTVITNEIGQRNDDPEQTVVELTTARDLGLPIIVWFSADTPGGARSLVNPDGTLRPTGVAFRRIVRGE
jgi:hypothetical protein